MATGQRCGSQKDPLATLAGQKEITWQRWFTKGSIGNAGWTERDHLATLWFTKGSIGNAGWTERDHLATLVHKRIHWQRWLDRKRSLGNAGSQKDPLATLASRESCGVVVCHKTNGDSKFECGRALPTEPYNSHDNHSSAPALLESAYRALLRSNNSDPSSAPAPTESAYRALLRLNGHSSAPALTQSACGAWLPPQRPPLLHIHHVLVGSGDVCFTTCTRGQRLLPVLGADGAVTSPASVERTKREHTELRSMGPCPRFTYGYSLHWSDCKRLATTHPTSRRKSSEQEGLERHAYTVAAYLPPSQGFTKEAFELLFNHFEPIFLIAGDWNAKHSCWGNPRACNRGNELIACLRAHNYNILATGSPTHFPYSRRSRPSAIDFAVYCGIPNDCMHIRGRADK
ncbi:hypothetical protein ACLKA7_000024 [Drosophila subpalustris]